MATVYCYVLKDQRKALELLMYCFAEKPLMAEFWCLLGDIYYEADEYGKAKCFYENAKILGSRRLNSDEWPFDISKYKDYPDKMIASCDEVISKAIRIKSQVR
jgi:tetratricopeptide (TPR) repeat protein